MAIDVHPGLHPLETGHEVRCWLYHDVNGRPIPRPEGWVPRTDVAAEEVLATGAVADHGLAAGTAVEATRSASSAPSRPSMSARRSRTSRSIEP